MPLFLPAHTTFLFLEHACTFLPAGFLPGYLPDLPAHTWFQFPVPSWCNTYSWCLVPTGAIATPETLPACCVKTCLFCLPIVVPCLPACHALGLPVL